MLDNYIMPMDCGFYLAKAPMINSNTQLVVLKLDSLDCLDLFVTTVVGTAVDKHIESSPAFYAYLSVGDINGAVRTIKSDIRRVLEIMADSNFGAIVYKTFPYIGEVVGDMSVDDTIVFVDENQTSYSLDFIILSVLKGKGFFDDQRAKRSKKGGSKNGDSEKTRRKRVQKRGAQSSGGSPPCGDVQ